MMSLVSGLVILVLGVELIAAHLSDDFNWTEERRIWRWNVDEYPHPKTNPRYCHRFSPSHVCDPDDILTTEKADQLDLIIMKTSNDTPCICPECPEPNGGLRIGIALLKNVRRPNEPESKIIRNFAENLRKQWKLGPCENDILILVATKDRLSYTDVGPGIAPYISNSEANQIFLENKAYFTAGNYFEGLKSMTENYHTFSRRMKVKEDNSGSNAGLIAGLVVGIIIVFVLIFLLAFIVYKRRKSQPTGRKSSVSEDVSSSWKRKDTTWMSLSSQYKPCKTEDDVPDSRDQKQFVSNFKTLEQNETMEQRPLQPISEVNKESEENETDENQLEETDNSLHGKTILEPSETSNILFTDI